MRILIRDPKTLTLYAVSGMEKFGSGMIFKTHTVLNTLTLHNYISYGMVCAKKGIFSKVKIYQSPFDSSLNSLKKYKIEAPWIVQTWSAACLRLKGTRKYSSTARAPRLKCCSVCCSQGACCSSLMGPGRPPFCIRYSDPRNFSVIIYLRLLWKEVTYTLWGQKS